AAHALRACCPPRGLARLGAARRRAGHSGEDCQRCARVACLLPPEGAGPPWGGPAAGRPFWRRLPTLRTRCVLAAPRGGWPALGRPGGGPAILAMTANAAHALRACCPPEGSGTPC